MTPPVLAIVVPCLNEEEALPSTAQALLGLLSRMSGQRLVSGDSFVLFVDDGSTDGTWDAIERAAADNPNVQGIKLSSNAGHQNALIAGMETAAGSAGAVVTVDADLQDDIEAIPEMVRKFMEGARIVYGVRANRDSDSWFKRCSAQAFYKALKHSGVDTVCNHADFRLMGADAVRDFMRYGERNMYIRGIVPLLDSHAAIVPYDRKPRVAGRSKYPLGKMLNFAIDGITSFSVRPVRMVSVIGIVFLIVALCISVYSLIRYIENHTIPGWTSLMLSVWLCSGTLLLSLGIVGEYVGKIYTEVKQRPRYTIERRTP